MNRALQELPVDVEPGPERDLTPTLDAELEENPYLRHQTVEDFVSHRMEGKTPNTPLPEP